MWRSSDMTSASIKHTSVPRTRICSAPLRCASNGQGNGRQCFPLRSAHGCRFRLYAKHPCGGESVGCVAVVCTYRPQSDAGRFPRGCSADRYFLHPGVADRTQPALNAGPMQTGFTRPTVRLTAAHPRAVFFSPTRFLRACISLSRCPQRASSNNVRRSRNILRDDQDGPSDADVWCVVCRLPETRCWHYLVQQIRATGGAHTDTTPRERGPKTIQAREVYYRAHSMDKPGGGSLAPTKCGHTRDLYPSQPQTYSRACRLSSGGTGFFQ